MIQYPDCPYCGNSTTALSVVDVEINNYVFKGIQCNSCKKFFGFFQEYSKQIEEIMERLDELENRIND